MAVSTDPSPCTNAATEPDDNAPPLSFTIRDLHAGKIKPADLHAETRRQIVAHLSGDGVSVLEMAVLLQCSERTIKRDRAETRRLEAVPVHPRAVREAAGDVMIAAETSIHRIRRALRDKDVPPGIRLAAEERCFRIARDAAHTLIRLGYPRADIDDRFDETMEKIFNQLTRKRAQR